MDRKLCKPIFQDNKKYIGVDLLKPTPSILSKTVDTINQKTIIKSMLVFVSNCIKALYDDQGNIETDKSKILKIMNDCPFESIEHLSCDIMVNYYNGEDEIFGTYNCPRCNSKIICDLLDDGTDTRDHYLDLVINYMPDTEENLIKVESDEPILIDDELIESISITNPTITDHIKAESLVGLDNEIKYQIQLIKLVTKKVNDRQIDEKYRMRHIDNILNKDISFVKKLGKEIKKYSLDKRVEKRCKDCGKVWKQSVNVSNFFVSALRSQES